MPLGWLSSVLEGRKKRKPMGDKRKKSKKGKKRDSAHFADPEGVDKESVAGKLRARNQRLKDQLDELN